MNTHTLANVREILLPFSGELPLSPSVHIDDPVSKAIEVMVRHNLRMLPVFFSLAGLKVSTEGKLFMGWFGPRGLASIVFGVIVVNANVPNSGPIAMTVVCTVMLSIIAHGVSANPWARGYGERFRRAQGGARPAPSG